MITVLLFAHLQDEIGQRELKLAIKEITVKDLKQTLTESYHLSQMETTMVAVNEEYALDYDVIRAGDVVALIPPVSGG
ncbi:molybdopterin converting factor subunit 1 [Caldibacillus thermoamylovorans]|uniref:molybdopterin converting factor subunit 1 n=1 Tax=Caldibacillus thermoamylovorans TaxID=35841 RepID=UPI000D55DBE5|nr:molybdopterin converting factor subunit 1 [Caldibacillus thermoamylovorans]AWI11111.1 molybdopterin converting factor subunit 1 [Caldibacillus thermoamylovorans]